MGDERMLRMLVVDDEPENAALMKRMFRRSYEVEVAHSGSEALQKLESGGYDVIITDQMMPGMSGTDLLTQSIALVPEAVRILVTGYPDLATAISSINAGRAYRFFTKPIDRSELQSAVDRAVAQQRSSDALGKDVAALQAQVSELRAQNAALEARIDAEVQVRSQELLHELTRLRDRNPYDVETGLYSRRALQRELEEEICRSERYGLLCSLALLRITNLEPAIAEEAVDRVASLLRLSMRRFDSAGRWSADTFGLFMPHTDHKGAEACVTRLHEALSRFAFGEHGDTGNLELAGAVAVYPISGNSAEELIAEAEKALG